MRSLAQAALFSLLLLVPLVSARADYRTLDTSDGQDALIAALTSRALAGKVILLDLDSTLLDTRPRQVAILRAWAAREGEVQVSGLSPEHIQSWDFRETLKRAGVQIAAIPALEKKVKKAWREGFWRNENLIYDLEIPGAARLARSLHAQGATLVYFGRRESQAAGTKASLARFGFPLDERAQLLLDAVAKVEGRKEQRQAVIDARAKVFAQAEALGEVTAAIDNEGPSVDELRARFGGALVIQMMTDGPGMTQSRGPKLSGFLRSSDKVARPGSNPDVPSSETPLEVLSVADGDTVKAKTPEGEVLTLRLIGIDTPEKDPLYDRASMADKKARHVKGYGPRLVADKNGWKEAKVFLEGLMARGKLYLEYDPNNEKSGHRDSTSSRRVLAYLFVVTPEGERLDVNALLASEGFTLDYAFRYPHKRGEEFRALIKAAKEAKRGYWSDRWQAPEGGADKPEAPKH